MVSKPIMLNTIGNNPLSLNTSNDKWPKYKHTHGPKHHKDSAYQQHTSTDQQDINKEIPTMVTVSVVLPRAA